jgi:DNA-binding CsgD family transcriptional regulator
MGSLIASAVERLAISRPRGTFGHAGALVIVGVAILVLELYLVELDHGTHLLVGLVLVAGTAVFLGPGPATSGLTFGAGTSVAAAAATVGGVLESPLTYLQLSTYLGAGGAIIGLASIAVRARMPAQAPSAAHGVASSHALTEPLTERESEILRLAASGISVDEIAKRVFLSPNTVKTHLTHVYAKLGVRGRPDAVRAGLHFGCLTPADICPHRYPPSRG